MKGIRSKMPLIKSTPKALNSSRLEEERVKAEKEYNTSFNLFSAIYQANSDEDKQMVAYYALDGMCLTAQASGDSLTKRIGEKWGSQLLFQRRQAATTPSTDQVEGMVIAAAKEQRNRESFLSRRGPGQTVATLSPEDDSSFTSTTAQRATPSSAGTTQAAAGWPTNWNSTACDQAQQQQYGPTSLADWLPTGSRGGRGRGRTRYRSRGGLRGGLFGQGRGGTWRGNGTPGLRGGRGGQFQGQQQQQGLQLPQQQQGILQAPQSNTF
jgi:hypothetical protein